jgi:CheY-like chemotaxis protein
MAKILVVDDEPNIREVVSLYVRREGHTSTVIDGPIPSGVMPESSVVLLPRLRGTESERPSPLGQ